MVWIKFPVWKDDSEEMTFPCQDFKPFLIFLKKSPYYMFPFHCVTQYCKKVYVFVQFS